MARFKDFGKGKEDGSETKEPIKFALHGEEFVCHPRMQGKTLLQFVELANSDDAGDSAKTLESSLRRLWLQRSTNVSTLF